MSQRLRQECRYYAEIAHANAGVARQRADKARGVPSEVVRLLGYARAAIAEAITKLEESPSK